MKVRTAIFLTYVVASAIGLLVLMRFVLAEVRPRYVSSIETTMRESARLIAGTLATQDPTEWPSILESADSASASFQLRVYDSAEGTVYAQEVEVEPEAYPGKDFRSSKERISRFIDNEPFLDDGQLVVTEDVLHGGVMVGRVELSRPLRSINSFIWSERRKLTSVALLIAAVMIVLGWWLAHKLTNSLGNLTRYAVAVRDGHNVTPPQSSAVEINALKDAVEGMRRTLEGRDFVHHYTQNLTHELKSPISAIRGAAELLGEADMPPSDREKFLRNIRAETDRLQQIVERVMELAELENREIAAATTLVRLGELIAEIAESVRSDREAKSIRWETATDLDSSEVRGDRFLLYHALLNPVINAVEFTPVGGSIRLSAVRERNHIRVTIEDDGPGIPDYALSRVFDRFYSLPRPDTGRKSTGLGLSFTREIVEVHGGVVWAENRAGGGALIGIELPAL